MFGVRMKAKNKGGGEGGAGSTSDFEPISKFCWSNVSNLALRSSSLPTKGAE